MQKREEDINSKRQLVYDMWIDHSTPSTDGHNGRNIIAISNCHFLLFINLNQKVLIEEKVNKHGQKVFQGPRMIATSPVCDTQENLFQSGVKVPIGALMSLKPFFINYATERDVPLLM